MSNCILVSALIMAPLSLLAQQGRSDAIDQQRNSMPAPAVGNPTVDQRSGKRPDNAGASGHFAVAHMYEEMILDGHPEYADKAIEELRLALAADPGSGFLAAALAELYAKMGRIRDAFTEAQNAIRRDPGNLEAQKLLGRLYLRSLGNAQSEAQSRELLKSAAEQYETIIQLEPNNPDNHVVLGRLYYLGKERVKAESEFKSALQLDPNSEEAITRLAYLYNEQEEAKKAAELLNAAAQGSHTARIFVALGYTDQQLKDYKKAVADYRKALVLQPANLDAMRGLAVNLENDNQLEAALEQYAALQRADPKDAYSAQRIVEIHRRLGKSEPSAEHQK
jgi:tetratricopeptide (TPR) repeat protein